MTAGEFCNAFLFVLNAMSPYLLLGFLIAGVLHVFVPKRFYAKYLSRDNKLSVLWAALLGVPLPLCSCGVIPTAVGLKNEGASKGALGMKFFDKFKKQETEAGTVVYAVEGMHCNHCKAAVEQSVGKLKGVETCEATPAANTLVVTGTASENDIRKAVEQAGFEFKGVK